MAIEIGRIEAQLAELSSEGAPGREFCMAIAELARNGRFNELRGVLPDVVFQELDEQHRRDPAAFVADWRSMAQQMRQGFIANARQRLTSLTRLRRAGAPQATASWQQIQRALDHQQNDLLRAAIALELLETVEPAVARAAHLRECVVATECSDEADRYLDEATRCYFFGLFTSCAVMCRSVLEEALRQKLPAKVSGPLRSRYGKAATLGVLLHEVNNNLRMLGIDPDFPRVANRVNDAGKRAVHKGLLSEDEARECLQDARRALELLLRE